MLILLTPVHGMICAKVERLQVKQMQRKDERVKLINEILSGIKVQYNLNSSYAFIFNIKYSSYVYDILDIPLVFLGAQNVRVGTEL